MIVFNLACDQEHRFEGWFASGDAFARQQELGLVSCPMCGSSDVHKQLSAPRLNLGHADHAEHSSHAQEPQTQERQAQEMQARETQAYMGSEQMLVRQFKQFIMSNTENVGAAFAETARRMHYGEEAHRNIRGKVSTEEAEELRDEGIDTMSLPVGLFMDDGIQ
jgi:hypothetical protein